MKLVKDTDQIRKKNQQVSDEKAEEAVRTLIQWIGEDQNVKDYNLHPGG